MGVVLDTVIGIASYILAIIFIALCIRLRLLRKYSYLVLYVGFSFVCDAIRVLFLRSHGQSSKEYLIVYLFLDFLLVLVRIVTTLWLLETTLRETPWPIPASSASFGRILVVAAMGYAFISRYSANIHRPFLYFEMQRILYVTAALVTVVLWIALLRSRSEDPQLRTVVCGFGLSASLQAAAWALLHGFRYQLATATATRLSLSRTVPIAWLVMLGLWCYALAFLPETKRTRIADQSSTQDRDPGLILAEN